MAAGEHNGSRLQRALLCPFLCLLLAVCSNLDRDDNVYTFKAPVCTTIRYLWLTVWRPSAYDPFSSFVDRELTENGDLGRH